MPGEFSLHLCPQFSCITAGGWLSTDEGHQSPEGRPRLLAVHLRMVLKSHALSALQIFLSGQAHITGELRNF